MKPALLLVVSSLALAACATGPAVNERGESGFIEELPEGVLAVADPRQPLDRVLVLPSDGCYWYQWVGPVETTMLPLMTTDARPICTRAQ